VGAAFYTALMLLVSADPGPTVVALAEPAPEPAANQAAAPGADKGAEPAGEAGEEGAKPGGQKQPQQGQKPRGGGWQSLLLPMLAIGFLFYFLLIRPQRQEQRRRQEMLGGVKKNDRVVTIGGIYGVVTNVHREADEVTIKVDETTNTKLRVTLGSVARIMGDEASGGPSSKA